MNTRILNRAGKLPDDGFYQIEAIGEHVNHEAKVIQVIDEKAVTSILNRFSAEVKEAGENFPGKPLDRDHLSDSMENTTEAYGWGMQLRKSGEGYEAKIDWTPIGEPLVTSKDGKPPAYKFFSTGYLADECEKIGTRKVGKKTYDVVRPLRLDSISLTNQPNNKKGQRPISNRNGNPAGAAEDKNDTPMKSLLKKLGLADDASEESAVAAVEKITNRATSAETERDALKKDNDALLASQVESDLEKYKNRFKPEKRDTIKAALIKNRAGTIELLESTEAPAAETTAEDPKKITNRGTAKTPEQIAADAKSRKEEERAAKISNRARQIRATNKNATLADAYQTAAAEIDAESK